MVGVRGRKAKSMGTREIHLTLPGQEPALPEPSEREQEEITVAKTHRIARRPRFALRTNPIRANHADAPGWCDRALDAFGTASIDFVAAELDRLAGTLGSNAAASEGTLNSALAVLDGQKPKDEVEAQLLIQMCAVHAVAMDFLARAKRASSIENVDSCGRVANRLLARYTEQCAALTSLRRGGKQVVEVQHVYRDRKKREGVPQNPQPRGPGGKFKSRSRALELADA
jgi:hypothetical protein